MAELAQVASDEQGDARTSSVARLKLVDPILTEGTAGAGQNKGRLRRGWGSGRGR